MKRSPWFNARTQPPVNGGPDALYEHLCKDPLGGFGRATREPAEQIKMWGQYCPRCQWRGLLREGKK